MKGARTEMKQHLLQAKSIGFNSASGSPLQQCLIVYLPIASIVSNAGLSYTPH